MQDPCRLVAESPYIPGATDIAICGNHKGGKQHWRNRKSGKACKRFMQGRSPRPGPPELMQANSEAIDSQRKHVRGEKQHDECCMRDEPHHPWTVLQPDRAGKSPERAAKPEFEVLEPERKRHAVEKNQRDESRDLKASFDGAFERHRTGHDQDLAKQIEKTVRRLDADVATDPGYDQVHRKVRNERPCDLIVGMRLCRAVTCKHKHSCEMIVIVHHRRRKARPKNWHHGRRKQQHKNDSSAVKSRAGLPRAGNGDGRLAHVTPSSAPGGFGGIIVERL